MSSRYGMRKFSFWLIERHITEINVLLEMVGSGAVPQLAMKAGVSDAASMVRILLVAYAKEIGIQSRHGGIRNPAVVVHNKIRHELTNYDTIRDALTREVNRGRMDICDALKVREQVVAKFKDLGESIISQLPETLKIHGNEIHREDLLAANANYERRELRDIAAEKSHNRCDGDDTGTSRYAPAGRTFGRSLAGGRRFGS